MSNWTLYHNPKCSKSRAALDVLRDKGVEPTIVEYLKTPLSEAKLKSLVKKLKIKPRELVRHKEPSFAGLKLDLDDEAAVIRALGAHPELLQRPIVVKGQRAVVGRPPENVLTLF